ncbi:hypothetical protein BDY17DRAFT_312452 [Neohortaea acidophila]|uniref:Uncharacterized protein n=1 Tax=Neohortaea acidophila TaxID=245834 RepID=A0A6A6PMT8_9PEZI|nr:uncharacterized protein BDY17DRAFT_312452 [Neohortaea acidophila]KAF2480577.1 hypothetical protein BDY17DRAFT_312452 [Neohortaea acidophila]
MKTEFAIALMAAVGALAAKNPGYGGKKHHGKKHHKHHTTAMVAPSNTSTTTITQDSCPTNEVGPETMITVTDGVTVTYCPRCEHMTMPVGPVGYTTVYTTTYEALCPTGMTQSTYTITESCTEPTPTWIPGSRHIPPGFTVTTAQCTMCAETPVPVTITEPCGCEAHEGTPGPPAPAPATGGSGPAPTGNGRTGGSAPGPACDGEDCGAMGHGSGSSPGSAAAAPPYPTPPATPHRVMPTGGAPLPTGAAPSGAPGSSSPMSPAPNAASSLPVITSTLVAVVVAVLALAL